MTSNSQSLSLQQRSAGWVGWLIGVVVLLLPLKFGSLAALPEAAGFFPEYWADWLIVSWPAHSFGIFSGALLLLAVVFFPTPPWNNRAGIAAALWGWGLPLAAGLGAIAGDPDRSAGEIGHFAAIGAFVLTCHRLIASDGRWRGRLAAMLAIGTFITALLALHQYFFGFDETRAFVENQRAYGIEIGEVMRAKLADNRAFGPMVSCNALGGFLLAALPITVLVFFRWAEYFSPRRVSRPLFFAVAAVVTGMAFLLTRSRGAYLCAVVVAVAFGFSLPWRRSRKLLAAAAAVLLIAAGAWYIQRAGRGFGSMIERASYLDTSWQMTLERPLTGWGWGGFFREHMARKTTDTDESSRDPHNLLAAFFSQCGVGGGLLAAAAVLIPAVGLWRCRRQDELAAAAAWGWAAFTLHSLMELNMQIPGSMAAAALLMLIGLSGGEAAVSPPRRPVIDAVALIPGLTAMAMAVVWLRGEVALARLTDAVFPATGEQLQMTLRDPGIVRRELENTVRFRPHSAQPWLLAGDWAARRGDRAVALAYYREALKREPGLPAVCWRLAGMALLEGDRVAAEQWREEARRRFPSHPRYQKPLP